MKDYRTLKVWEKGHASAVKVYRATANFPRSEQFGLTSQIRRAGASIPANIAEGCGRWGDPELCHFLQMAMGSLLELDYHLLLSKDLGLLQEHAYMDLCADVDELKRMLGALIYKMRNKN